MVQLLHLGQINDGISCRKVTRGSEQLRRCDIVIRNHKLSVLFLLFMSHISQVSRFSLLWSHDHVCGQREHLPPTQMEGAIHQYSHELVCTTPLRHASPHYGSSGTHHLFSVPLILRTKNILYRSFRHGNYFLHPVPDGATRRLLY